ncbi:MAG: cell envelope integrity protein CreD [Cytophagales bacterium]|nr:cell envelope integrity protein CreD [Cytophagales bacterium]
METQNKNMLDRINERISQSVTFKLISIGILILLLLIPKSMINSLIIERERRMQETIHEVTDKWSRSQTVSGPSLIIPYKKRIEPDDEKKAKMVIRYATFLPEELNVKSVVDPEERYRGIFRVIVYRARLSLTGKFPKPDFSKWDIPDSDILWSRAMLNLGISDLRGIEKQVSLNLGSQSHPFLPGVSQGALTESGIHMPLEPVIRHFHENDFSIDISLKGSERLYFVPLGKDTEVKMTSSWKDPSFTGSFLPKERGVGPKGFEASWQVLHFNRNYPQSWINQNYFIGEENYQDDLYGLANTYPGNVSTGKNDIGASKFGVILLVAADHYQKSLRSSKYSILIITLSFLMFFLIEVTQKLRIHAFQYILIGLALMIFYTLLLSISEHLGFNVAYWVSSISVIGLIALYSSAVLSNKRLAFLLTGSLIIIYGFLFLIIQIETYALLAGSIGLFIILALTMYYTRKITWYRTTISN